MNPDIPWGFGLVVAGFDAAAAPRVPLSVTTAASSARALVRVHGHTPFSRQMGHLLTQSAPEARLKFPTEEFVCSKPRLRELTGLIRLGLCG